MLATRLVQFMERYVITNDVVNAYGSFSSAQAQVFEFFDLSVRSLTTDAHTANIRSVAM